MKRSFWKKGSAEIIAFVMILPFLILPIINTVNMLSDLVVYDRIRQAARQAIICTEIDGGLTWQKYVQIYTSLEDKIVWGNWRELHFDYTGYPVEYGEEVKVKISYNYPRRRYSIGLGGIKRIDEPATMVYGPLKSISKKYER